MAKKCAICTILLDVLCPNPLCPGHHNDSRGTICAYCASNARAEVPFSAHLAPSILSTLEGLNRIWMTNNHRRLSRLSPNPPRYPPCWGHIHKVWVE